MTEVKRVVVLQAGLRMPSTTRMLADELARALGATGAVEVTVVDLRDHAHPIMDAMLSGFATGDLQTVLDAVATADGMVVVTPTFQGSYSGLFKSFADLIEPGSLSGKPVVMAATGGTERHSLMLDFALRPLMAHLGAEPVRTAVFAATGDFGSGELTGRAQRAAGELAHRMGVGSASPATGAPAEGSPAEEQIHTPSTSARPAAGFGDSFVDFETLMDRLGVKG